jgi:hypothetical protein
MVFLVGADGFLTVFSSISKMSFDEASTAVNALAKDHKVDFFTEAVFAELKSMTLVLGIGLIAAALVWILYRKRSLVWVDAVWLGMKSRIHVDLVQIAELRQSGRVVNLMYLTIPAVFWGIYTLIGLSLRNSAIFLDNDMLFDTDIVAVVKILSQLGGESERHPFFGLLFSPLVSLLARAIQSPLAAAIILNSFFGSLTVWFTLIILVRLGLKPVTAALWAVVFGLSTSQIVFGSLPETYSFAACSLALIFYLMLLLPGNLLAFIPAAVFTFGVTGTNDQYASFLVGVDIHSCYRSYGNNVYSLRKIQEDHHLPGNRRLVGGGPQHSFHFFTARRRGDLSTWRLRAVHAFFRYLRTPDHVDQDRLIDGEHFPVQYRRTKSIYLSSERA